jgi:hemerythrin-like domain-containing protein
MTTTPTPRRTGQLLLPGQAAAPDGPVDLTVMWLMHHGFRRDLEKFGRAVPATPLDDRVSWSALARRWEVFAEILHDHHAGEDAGLWPLLLERVDAAGDGAGRATLEAMSAEHGRIDPLLDACAAGFQRMARTPDAAVRDDLAQDLAAASAHLGAHLAHEEQDAMRLVQGHLSQDEWQRLSVEYFEKPLTTRQLLRVAAWCMQELPHEGVDRLRQGDPKGPVLILTWRLLLRRPFERRESRAFRYA